MSEMPPGYDAWKTRSDLDDLQRGCRWGNDPEPYDEEPHCAACLDEGWMLDEQDRAIPCTECSAPLVPDDLDEQDAIGALER